MSNKTQNRKDNIHLNLLVKIVKQEIDKLFYNDGYYGTKEQIDNQKSINEFYRIKEDLEHYINDYNRILSYKRTNSK